MLYDLLLAKSLNGGGGSGGGGLFVATYTNNNDTWECDKTLDEILSAVEVGKAVWAYNSDEDAYYPIDSYYPGEEGEIRFCFINYHVFEGSVFLDFAVIYHNRFGGITVEHGSGSFPAET